MEHRWSKKELLNLRDNLTKKHEKYDIKQIDEMLSIVSNKINFAEIDIVPPDAEFEFNTNFGNFKKGLEIYPEWLEDSIIDLFKIEPDINYFMGEHTLNTCNLSNKLMLTLAHDILYQLKDDRLMKYFYHIINNDNHLLHITNKTDSEASNSTLYGIKR